MELDKILNLNIGSGLSKEAQKWDENYGRESSVSRDELRVWSNVLLRNPIIPLPRTYTHRN